AGRLVPFLAAAGYTVTPGDLLPMVPLVQERLKTLAEAVDWLDFFFEDHIDYETSLLIGKKMTAAESYQALLQARQVLATLPTFEAGPIETALRDLANGLELKVGQLLGMIRIAVSGKKVAPPLFETLAILGQKRTLARLDQGLGALAPMQ
ncbi:MAG: glutamate--tRNA ligase, partial [Anaerolineae bacterium]